MLQTTFYASSAPIRVIFPKTGPTVATQVENYVVQLQKKILIKPTDQQNSGNLISATPSPYIPASKRPSPNHREQLHREPATTQQALQIPGNPKGRFRRSEFQHLDHFGKIFNGNFLRYGGIFPAFPGFYGKRINYLSKHHGHREEIRNAVLDFLYVLHIHMCQYIRSPEAFSNFQTCDLFDGTESHSTVVTISPVVAIVELCTVSVRCRSLRDAASFSAISRFNTFRTISFKFTTRQKCQLCICFRGFVHSEEYMDT